MTSTRNAGNADWAARVAGFVCRLRWADIPTEVRATSRAVFIDCLGAALAGSRDPGAQLVQDLVRDAGATSRCTVVGTDLASAPELAALANGFAAHAIDIDDTSRSMNGHASISVVPVCLALGETEARSGAEVFCGFVVGFELQAKLGALIGPRLRQGGWHSAGVLGTLGATAAAANLLRLDEGATALALGIAVSLASGLGPNIGSMTKPLHSGNAARNGIIGATLAAGGFTSQPGALAAYLRSFAGRTHAPAEALTDFADRLGRPFDLVEPGTDIKLYPCCSYTHPAIDAALELVAKEGVVAEAVDRVVVRIGSRGRVLLRRSPRTTTETRFSLEFCVACALTHGRVGVDHFTEAELQRLSTLMELIRIIDDDPAFADPEGRPARLRIVLGSGKAVETAVEEPRGSALRPLAADEIEVKYRSLAGLALAPGAVEASLGYLRTLDEQETITPLMRCLSVAGEGGEARAAGDLPWAR